MESTRAASEPPRPPLLKPQIITAARGCRSSRIATAMRCSGESVGANESGVGRGGVGCRLAGRTLGAVNGRGCMRVGGLAGWSVRSD
jgi:hypothetical protein